MYEAKHSNKTNKSTGKKRRRKRRKREERRRRRKESKLDWAWKNKSLLGTGVSQLPFLEEHSWVRVQCIRGMERTHTWYQHTMKKSNEVCPEREDFSEYLVTGSFPCCFLKCPKYLSPLSNVIFCIVVEEAKHPSLPGQLHKFKALISLPANDHSSASFES